MEATTATRTDPEQLTEVCFKLTQAEAATLQGMAGIRGVPVDQIIREAIVEKKYFDDQRRQGMKVVLQGDDGRLTPLSFAS